MPEIFYLILLALLGSVFGLVGGLTFLFIESWSRFLVKYSTPFAAGVLITVSLVGLLPEAFEVAGENAFLITLASFLSVFLLENLLVDLHHHHHPHSKKKDSSTTLVIIGDTLHNFIDGVAIAAAFLVNPGLGLITAFSTFLHEVPHEIGDFGILLKAGWKHKHIILVNFFSAMTTVLGALFVYYYVGVTEMIGILLAVAAGIFLYLGASDFLPETLHESGKKGKTAAMVLLGVATMLITFSIVPHGY